MLTPARLTVLNMGEACPDAALVGSVSERAGLLKAERSNLVAAEITRHVIRSPLLACLFDGNENPTSAIG